MERGLQQRPQWDMRAQRRLLGSNRREDDIARRLVRANEIATWRRRWPPPGDADLSEAAEAAPTAYGHALTSDLAS
ncbi:hypothetical protein Arub01_22630 [Actinomadura rubrobrunea]|uniref:Uncharacterized protein n=1 Tax=Actinomadura rubrobrunea TaxID=115335 RepID=A0A9W6PT20_9ACTN|nr:hypothetical protein Arub01_22630 [Actinomadura rubrobrunea]